MLINTAFALLAHLYDSITVSYILVKKSTKVNKIKALTIRARLRLRRDALLKERAFLYCGSLFYHPCLTGKYFNLCELVIFLGKTW